MYYFRVKDFTIKQPDGSINKYKIFINTDSNNGVSSIS